MALTIFERVSFDLIYARPVRPMRRGARELKRSARVRHRAICRSISSPSSRKPLRIVARQGRLKLPGRRLAAALYETTQELTEAAGLSAYEISNHARPGEESRHNLIYWRYGDYAGVGPGAHGRLNLNGKRLATAATRLPERWRDQVENKGHGFAEMTDIAPEEAAREHLLMALRLAEGLDLAAYEMRWGMRPDAAKIAALIEQGMLYRDNETIAATPQGRLVLNAVIAALLN